MLCLSSVARLCFSSRYCCTHLRPPHVCQDGDFPGDAVPSVWEALQRGPFLQRKSPCLFCCFYRADGAAQRGPSPPWTRHRSKGSRTARLEQRGVCSHPDVRAWFPGMSKQGGFTQSVNITSHLFSPARVTAPRLSPPRPKHLPPRSPLQPVR